MAILQICILICGLLFNFAASIRTVDLPNPNMDIAILLDQSKSMNHSADGIDTIKRWVEIFFTIPNASSRAKFAVQFCRGPELPWLKVYLTPGNPNTVLDSIGKYTVSESYTLFGYCTNATATQVFNVANGDRPDSPNYLLWITDCKPPNTAHSANDVFKYVQINHSARVIFVCIVRHKNGVAVTQGIRYDILNKWLLYGGHGNESILIFENPDRFIKTLNDAFPKITIDCDAECPTNDECQIEACKLDQSTERGSGETLKATDTIPTTYDRETALRTDSTNDATSMHSPTPDQETASQKDSTTEARPKPGSTPDREIASQKDTTTEATPRHGSKLDQEAASQKNSTNEATPKPGSTPDREIASQKDTTTEATPRHGSTRDQETASRKDFTTKARPKPGSTPDREIASQKDTTTEATPRHGSKLDQEAASQKDSTTEATPKPGSTPDREIASQKDTTTEATPRHDSTPDQETASRKDFTTKATPKPGSTPDREIASQKDTTTEATPRHGSTPNQETAFRKDSTTEATSTHARETASRKDPSIKRNPLPDSNQDRNEASKSGTGANLEITIIICSSVAVVLSICFIVFVAVFVFRHNKRKRSLQQEKIGDGNGVFAERKPAEVKGNEVEVKRKKSGLSSDSSSDVDTCSMTISNRKIRQENVAKKILKN